MHGFLNHLPVLKRRTGKLQREFVLTLLAIAFVSAPAFAESNAEPEQSDRSTNAVLPSLSILLPPNSPLRLRFPDEFVSDGDNEVYTRRFPLGGQAAVDRGVTLPKPWGISFTYVDNSQPQNIEDISVALAKGAPPPPDTPLVDLPFVQIDNAESNTRTKQVRADLWVLPFLNVFGALGKVEGEVPLDVVVDLNATGLCPPILTCKTVGASFEAGVDTYTATLGLTGVYGWDNWFVSVSASFTDSFGGNTDDAVRSVSVSGRVGRRWAFGPGHMISPFVGVSYLDIDQVVEGVARLRDAFPDGDDLSVRYRASISNQDKWSGVVGLNLGFIQGFSVAGEYNYSGNSERFVVSTTYRF